MGTYPLRIIFPSGLPLSRHGKSWQRASTKREGWEAKQKKKVTSIDVFVNTCNPPDQERIDEDIFKIHPWLPYWQ